MLCVAKKKREKNLLFLGLLLEKRGKVACLVRLIALNFCLKRANLLLKQEEKLLIKKKYTFVVAEI